jgi:hypothetical protein
MLAPMRTGIGLILLLGSLEWGCAPARKAAAPTSPAVNPEEKLLSIDAKPAVTSELEARVEGDLLTVTGKPYEGKELAEELGRLRGGRKVLKLRVTPEATDLAFADALQAAAKAGFEHVAIDHGGEQLTAEVNARAEQVRIVSWRSNDRLIVFDLKPPAGTSGWLGGFRLRGHGKHRVAARRGPHRPRLRARDAIVSRGRSRVRLRPGGRAAE